MRYRTAIELKSDNSYTASTPVPFPFSKTIFNIAIFISRTPPVIFPLPSTTAAPTVSPWLLATSSSETGLSHITHRLEIFSTCLYLFYGFLPQQPRDISLSNRQQTGATWANKRQRLLLDHRIMMDINPARSKVCIYYATTATVLLLQKWFSSFLLD